MFWRMKKSAWDDVKVEAHNDEVPDFCGNIACVLVERWGTVAAEPDGEDSTGRAKMKLQTPQDLVNRAITTAEILVEGLQQRGHMLRLPEEMKRALLAANEIAGAAGLFASTSPAPIHRHSPSTRFAIDRFDMGATS